MIRITRISTQQKSKHRYNIFIDEGQGEKYGFSVDEDVLIAFNLRKNLTLDPATIQTLLKSDTLHQSYHQVIGYLGYRMRTKKEIRDYLIKKETDEVHIKQIIKKLQARHLINDEEFADSFVKTRIQTTTKGPGLVKNELIAKGITDVIADQAIKQYNYGVQFEKATKIAEKRLTKNSRHSFKKQREQLQMTLMRNGFTQEVIRDVLENIDEIDVSAEMNALAYHGERAFQRYQEKFTGYELTSKVKENLYRRGFSIETILHYLQQINEE